MNINKLINIARGIAIERFELNDTTFNHVAIITTSKSIVAIGRNNIKMHPAVLKYDYRTGIHAEMDACIKVDRSIIYNNNHLYLYSFRFVKTNYKLAMAKPCNICQQYINDLINAGWNMDVFYSTNTQRIVQL